VVVEHLSTSLHLPKLLKELGVDGGGLSILRDKGVLHFIRITSLHVGAANILKQDALSIGADLAVPKGTVIASTPYVNVLLIANEKQLRELSRKEKAQPFGLKELAVHLEQFCTLQIPTHVEVMGVINANEDSFYPQSRFSATNAITAIETMIDEGADIVDIGGVSSRPGSLGVSESEELLRVSPIIDALYAQKLYEKIRFSIDSYTPSVIEYALERGFCIVNDISGLSNDAVSTLCAQFDATAVIMHMQGSPQNMQLQPTYGSVLHEVEIFFKERIQNAEALGVKKIILDCGIGFGKRLEDNLELIRHQKHFLRLGKPLLVGASRKSLINTLSPSLSEDRLGGTLALHLRAIQEGASMVRVHDVKEHVQAIKVYNALREER
jgi:dihydropteroate synthase